MTELDLNGELFLHFPTELSLQESRERLELEILFAAMEDGADEDEISISPYWIVRVLCKRAMDELKGLPRDRRIAAVRAARKAFLENRKSTSNRKENK